MHNEPVVEEFSPKFMFDLNIMILFYNNLIFNLYN